jgi:predicted SnoaL-like aldol condensation-catalyzing enzyme
MEAAMDLEQNKRTVVEYYELAFNEHKPEEAVEKYVGSRYIQHNPQAPTGPRRSSRSLRPSPRSAWTSAA